jgi:transposase
MYPPELGKRAVRMVAEIRGDYPTETAALNSVMETLGIGSRETLRKWFRQDQIDTGQRPGNDERGGRAGQGPEEGDRRAEAGERDPQGGLGFFAAEFDQPHTRS